MTDSTSQRAPIPTGSIEYTRARFRNADAVLFGGAGLSRDARGSTGFAVPTGWELAALVWSIAYPGSKWDEKSSLKDVYAAALRRDRVGLERLMNERFTIAPESLPESYGTLFSMPWKRAYTLNVDNLERAAAVRFNLPRKVVSISAVTGRAEGDVGSPGALEVFHLNGMLSDGIANITFSQTQFSNRHGIGEGLLHQAAVDVLSGAVVFVGTQLDEEALWHHVEARKHAAVKDLRRRSFIVIPELPRARLDLLQHEFHAEHIARTFAEWISEVVAPAGDAAAEGLAKLDVRTALAASASRIPLVSDLSATGPAPGALPFLLGAEPTWSDLVDGRAARLQAHDTLADLARQGVSRGGGSPPIFLSGTAGSGKSTAARAAALKLTSDGTTVGWFDASFLPSAHELRKLVSRADAPQVLVIDDADRYGSELASLATEFGQRRPPLQLVAVGRAGRMERVGDRLSAAGVEFVELLMPPLSDADISAILGALKDQSLLGNLIELSPQQRQDAFRRVADRQLIVAMIEATSGRRFDEKIQEELQELPAPARMIYALLGVATSHRIGLSAEGVLLAIDGVDNESLRALDDLVRRGLAVIRADGLLWVRHRVVGEKIVAALSEDGSLVDIVVGMCRALATPLWSPVSRRGAEYRRLRPLMQHDWLMRNVGSEGARRVMEELGGYLSWDHHYFLQRGSLELELGNVDLAENYLLQAEALEPSDPLVGTELGYLRLKKAIVEANGEQARAYYTDGRKTLEGVLVARKHSDPHQIHILAANTLAFSRRSDIAPEERKQLLASAAGWLVEGRRLHGRDERLRELYVTVQNERLGLGWAGGVD